MPFGRYARFVASFLALFDDRNLGCVAQGITDDRATLPYRHNVGVFRMEFQAGWVSLADSRTTGGRALYMRCEPVIN